MKISYLQFTQHRGIPVRKKKNLTCHEMVLEKVRFTCWKLATQASCEPLLLISFQASHHKAVIVVVLVVIVILVVKPELLN